MIEQWKHRHREPAHDDPEQPAKCMTPEELHAKIALLAYHVYENRMCQPGHDVDDWLLAEKIVAMDSWV